jgi:hypothetical protein
MRRITTEIYKQRTHILCGTCSVRGLIIYFHDQCNFLKLDLLRLDVAKLNLLIHVTLIIAHKLGHSLNCY